MPINMEITETETNNESVQESTQDSVQESAQDSVKKIEVNKTLLVNIKSIIDVVSLRGVFKPSEMTIVGRLYEEIVSHIKD